MATGRESQYCLVFDKLRLTLPDLSNNSFISNQAPGDTGCHVELAETDKRQ